ncbi:MAG: hypothetical protein GFH27_549283n422 [Chloroflexi bacterium AL-W]|nr:hypothetical protein [Chloroflexi bacterium AL-N1]NOK64457.1 hypothetical protein [Chloroflexi bacterium AL-N10]NOK75699.1 hypothetical protein [Chloroflexi bacterium AL-N5]NOK80543.1 hypothetical protein [Chloroflexi bacterium AL-W]NOK87057.1 hypothetical protein [Chloroflexi bacterium AL-N15]
MGVWTIIAGSDTLALDSPTIAVAAMNGAGMPAVDNILTPYGLRDGAYHQRQVAQPRVITLRMTAIGDSLTELHTRRKQLIALLQRDRSIPQQPIKLKYTGGASPVEIEAYYDSGLEIGELFGYNERIMLQFVCPDPLWRSLGTTSETLHVYNYNLGFSHIAVRGDEGVWGATGQGTLTNVMAIAPDNRLYAGLAFSPGLQKYVNGIGWQTVGTGLNGGVSGITFAANGDIYVTGDFTTAGGVSANCVAKWDGASWSALGSGLNSYGLTIAVGHDGTVYVGGNFSTAGGVSASGVAQWNGASWSAMSGLSVVVHQLIIDLDGSVIAGGSFSGKVKRWNGASWSALGSGPGGLVTGLAMGNDGYLYAAGSFTGKAARWNGVRWATLGAGFTGSTNKVTVAPDGLVYIAGNFSTAGSIPTPDGMAIWNGSAFAPLDANLPGTEIKQILVTNDGLLYAACNGSSSGTMAEATYITNNGTAPTAPTIEFSGPGRLYSMRNVTTGQTIYFDLALLDGETATLDLSAKTFVSDFRGNIISAILPGSTFATWRLLPGENVVATYIDNASASASVAWYLNYWSVDV